MRGSRVIAGLVVALCLMGCTTKHLHEVCQRPVQETRAIVFVVDGAGGHHPVAYGLGYHVCNKRLPLLIQPYIWTHGVNRYALDQVDRNHIDWHGKQLAQHICTYHRNFPERPIYLVSYSAGAGIALQACRHLPRDIIERTILLAPAVSENYLLVPTLRASRLGVDVYTSDKDTLWLGLITNTLGTTGGPRERAAGRRGFRIDPATPEEGEQFTKLRQLAWSPEISWTGHEGGHFGVYQLKFLEAYILPLLPVDRQP